MIQKYLIILILFLYTDLNFSLILPYISSNNEKKTDIFVSIFVFLNGAAYRDRTDDLLITNELLCQLS